MFKTKWEFVDDEKYSGMNLPIRIKNRKYKGVVYHYTVITPKEQDGSLILDMDFQILENPEKTHIGKDFVNVIGEILVKMLKYENQFVSDMTTETKSLKPIS